MVERQNDVLEIAEQCWVEPASCHCFLPTMFASLHTSLQAETHNENDLSVTNQIEYTGFRQGSYL